MRQIRWFSLLIAAALLLASCQAGGVAVSLESVLELDAPVDSAAHVISTGSTPSAPAAAEPVSNECLNCHVDKDLLIETARPEEAAAESESKGVG
jgi:hypothetical protein